jgi:hypothetical protein
MATPGGAARQWPAAAFNFTAENVRTAFGLDKQQAQEFLSSDSITSAVSELVAWKAKFLATQAPSLAQVNSRNMVPAGGLPAGKPQVYST